MNLPTTKPNDIDYARLMREWELLDDRNKVLERENAALRDALNNATVLLRRWNKNDVTDDIVVETRKAICAVLKDTKS